MRWRSETFLLSTLLLVLLLGWWQWASDDAPPPGDGIGQAPSTPQQPSPRATPIPPESEPPQCRLHVELRERGRLVAPPVAPFHAVWTATGQPCAVEALAGAGAALLQVDRRPGQALVRIRCDDERALLRVWPIDDVTAPQSLEVGGDGVIRGVVRDARGEPVAGARIWAGELRRLAIAAEATSDEAGQFELTTPSGGLVPLVVRAEGHAFALHLLPLTAATAAVVEVALPEEGRLSVQIAAGESDAVVAPDGGIDFGELFAVPTAEPTTELLRHPFLLRLVTGGARVDERGRAELRGLPRRSEIALMLVHPRVPIPSSPGTVRLVGAAAQHLLPFAARPAMHGRVVDTEGVPLPGALVVCRFAGREPRGGAHGRRLLPPLLDAAGCCIARADVDGRFVVGMPADAGPFVVSVRAPGLGGVDLDVLPRSVASGVELPDVVLPPWREDPVVLVVPAPLPGRPWSLQVAPLQSQPVRVAADQAFELFLPQAALFDVEVTRHPPDGTPVRRVMAGLPVCGTTPLPAGLWQ